MAVYKVPQDVEADDKLIGPFSFRQFVYLLIAGGLIALAVALFQIFPALAIIPLPPVFLFLALALPLKKDQPMETYLAALVSYYLKPRVRRWMPGQRESTIIITAPKVVEEVRTRDLSQEEATNRLSFLADIVDSQGYAIKGMGNYNTNMRDDLVAEANATDDMFDSYQAMNLSRAVEREQRERHAEAIRGMQEAIRRNESLTYAGLAGEENNSWAGEKVVKPEGALSNEGRGPVENSVEKSVEDVVEKAVEKPEGGRGPEITLPEKKPETSRKMQNLANNNDYSVATIAKEANRINRKDDDEVFISLH